MDVRFIELCSQFWFCGNIIFSNYAKCRMYFNNSFNRVNFVSWPDYECASVQMNKSVLAQLELYACVAFFIGTLALEK